MPTSFQLLRFIIWSESVQMLSGYFAGPRPQAVLGEQPLPHSQRGSVLPPRVPG